MKSMLPLFSRDRVYEMGALMAMSIVALLLAYSQTTGFAFPATRNYVNQAIIHAQFTVSPIQIDAIAESAWQNAQTNRVDISMNSELSAAVSNCTTYGEVRALWDGAMLYLLFEVFDSDVTTTGEKATDKDGVEIFVDLWNDKFPKYEEDDMLMRISSANDLSGTGTYADRLTAHAVKLQRNDQNVVMGYTIELAFALGSVPMKNGSAIGIEFGILDALSSTNKCAYRIFWSDGNNHGVNDNSNWGTLVLEGYDGIQSQAIDTYALQANIKKAESLPRKIWVRENELDKTLNQAKIACTEKLQTKIDVSNAALEQALKSLRRKGMYKDPYDLSETSSLPDPFLFLSGKKVKSSSELSIRQEEIKNLAQYYEYGTMPNPPAGVTTSVNGNVVSVTVYNDNTSASFDALLNVPTVAQCGKAEPYPVIVSIDFRASEAQSIYLNAGYAVLSIVYSSIASDNFEHKGAFYTLYPYDVTTGHDAGTLLAWAWGASRGIDALADLAKNNVSYKNTFDLEKLVVTGFSRCGKAALVAGLFDKRFGIVSPAASGCGGAAAYRYASFANRPYRTANFGNVYAWGISPGCEVLPDKIRHQGHNSNEMLSRFLNFDRPYKTKYPGYGQRLPYDHHALIAAIAPRAVLITTANDDYANNAEGDCIGMEGARPVFKFLDVDQNLALNIRTTGERNPFGRGGGHFLSDEQIKNAVAFYDMIFYKTPLNDELKKKFYTDPYLPTFNKYYGGLNTMMPWAN